MPYPLAYCDREEKEAHGGEVMDWFQHSTGSHEDPDLSDAWDKFGDAAVTVFWTTLEIYGKEFKDVDKHGALKLSLGFVSRKMRRKFSKFQKIFEFFQERGRILFRVDGDFIYITIPKFIDKASNWTKRPKVEPTEAPTEVTTEAPTAKEIEIEIEEEREEKDKKQDAPDEELKEVVTRVQNAFPKFNVFPFIQTYKKENRAAMIYTLNRLMDYHAQGIPVRSPYKFCMDVMANENGKFNAREHEAKAQEYKGPITDPTILAMVKNIGK